MMLRQRAFAGTFGASSASAFDRVGRALARFEARDGENLIDFRARALAGARGAAGATRVALGGLIEPARVKPVGGLPRGSVGLPDIPLHPNQVEALDLIERSRRTCLVCGRRWGKSTVVITLAVGYALMGRSVGIYAPTYRLMRPLLDSVALALGHLPGVKINRADNEIRLMGSGAIDFWSIDVTQRAGRGRAYDLVLVDEAAHDEGDYLKGTLEAAIAPATIDRRGRIVLASTPNGLSGAFWECANTPEKGYVVHHAPTSANPHPPRDEIAYLRTTLRAEVASQELDAVFLDTGGASIFPLSAFLIDGEPRPDEGWTCDFVGLAIDSNSGKGGPDRDGAAAVIFAGIPGVRATIVDWDIVSLSQGHVADWLAHVRRLAWTWYLKLKPMQGLPKAWVEPAGNAPSIIETCHAQGISPHEIDTGLVALGKDGRALAAEPHVSGGLVKIAKSALDKRTNYRGVTANHLVRQVTGFKTFDKEAYKREDDLLDAAVYSILLSLGDGTKMRWSRLTRPVEAKAAE
jgi:hypothetical protein